MPTTQVELDYGNKTLGGIVYERDREEHFRMAHKAKSNVSSTWHRVSRRITAYFVILSSILRGSRMKVGKTTRLRSAPGRSCEMI